MKKLFVIFFLTPYFYSCSQGVQRKVEIKEGKSSSQDTLRGKRHISSIDDLVGVWANSKTDSLRLGRMSLDEYFYPCTGFSISKIKEGVLKIYVQYGEQKQTFIFIKVKIKQGQNVDTLIGNDLKNVAKPIAFIYSTGFLDLQVADYKVLERIASTDEIKYFKILEKPCEGDFSNHILAALFKILPINITIDNKKYLIKQTSDDNCFFIPITGYGSYNKIQINNYRYDSLKKEKIFSLSFSDGKGGVNKIIEMRRDESGNVLAVH